MCKKASQQEVPLESCEGLVEVGGGEEGSGAEVQAHAKQSSEVWRWGGCSAEVVAGDVCRTVEINPARHIAKLDCSVMVSGLKRIRHKAITLSKS